MWENRQLLTGIKYNWLKEVLTVLIKLMTQYFATYINHLHEVFSVCLQNKTVFSTTNLVCLTEEEIGGSEIV